MYAPTTELSAGYIPISSIWVASANLRMEVFDQQPKVKVPGEPSEPYLRLITQTLMVYLFEPYRFTSSHNLVPAGIGGRTSTTTSQRPLLATMGVRY